MDVSCVVLSGGHSSRYHGDKLRAMLNGKPVISHVIDCLRKVTPRIFLSVADETQARELLKSAGEDLPIIQDEAALGLKGPPAGIVSSLTDVESKLILFVSGDIPWVESEALTRFVQVCLEEACDVGTVFWPCGMTENLIQFHQRERSVAPVLRVARVRNGKMRASDVMRGVRDTVYVDVGKLTSNPLCFANINVRSDLEDPRPRGSIEPGRGNVRVVGLAKESYRRAIKYEKNADYLKAARYFELEAHWYKFLGINQIAIHALQDCVNSKELGCGTSGKLRQRIAELASKMQATER